MFKNRIDAARKLLPYLGKYRKEKGVVLALPKGSVPMAYLIARHLGFPLDLMMTKKIGYPGSPEFAIGSVSLIGRILDPEKDIELLQEQSNRFIGNKKPVPLQGKTVILIDDGIATGYTMLEAIQLVRDQNPKKIVVAVPVASPEAVAFFKPRVDEIICLYQPKDFKAVGQFYEDFPQVTDEEVIHCMQDAQNLL
jgi:predicted phosphoribosyltransferase